MTVAVIIPTIRPDRQQWMLQSWGHLFDRHKCAVYWVHDGPDPMVEGPHGCRRLSESPHRELIFNFNDGVRNFGFLTARQECDPDVYITLDDDVRPDGNDPVQEHLDILGQSVPVTWMSSAGHGQFMRGFPYRVRNEAKVMVSHGVWKGVPDLDAMTALVTPSLKPDFYRGIVPKHAMFPVCGMNLAWTRQAARWVYFAPMGPSTPFNRFSDVWMGMELKRSLDDNGGALATGFSTVWHEKASDVWKNLEMEQAGLLAHEFPDRIPESYTVMWKHALQRWELLMV